MTAAKTASTGNSALAALYRQPWGKAAAAVGVTVLYALSAWLGLKLAVVHGNVTAIWPPSGIALAALLLLGPRFWPAVAAGALLVCIATGLPLVTGIGIATGNTLAALAGVQLVRRFSGAAGPLDTVRSLLVLLGSGALLATVVSATVGVTALALTGLAPADALLSIWLTWWLGDATGAIIFAPLCLAWSAPATPLHPGRPQASSRWGRRYLFTGELLLLAAGLVLTAQLVFGGWFITGGENYPLAFLLLPVLIWAGFRFGKRGATAAVATMSVLAVWGTVLGYGPFAHADLNNSLLLLQVFMSVNAVTTLMLVAVLQERDVVRQGLQQVRDELEQRVQNRTRALLDANRFLLDEIREHRSLQERVSAAARSSRHPDGAETRHVYERINRSMQDDSPQSPLDATIFAERLESAMQYARITRRRVAVMHVSIAGAGGVAAASHDGDDTELLQQVAERLRSVLRDTDILACRDAGEFAILLEGIRELDDVAAVAERIIHELCIPFVTGPERQYLAASVGISIFPDDAADAPSLCSYADAAMLLASDGGGRKYHFHIEERAAIDAEVSRLIGHS